MNNADLEKYCTQAIEKGVTHAVPIDPKTIVTAPWVRLKCQFGCPSFNKSYCCPPDSPTPEQTQAVIDSYQRAILFHLEAKKEKDRSDKYKSHLKMLIDLEGELFKDGYYKALVFLCGPCRLCRVCLKLKGESCVYGFRARPSMEACGIDVYRTVRNNNLFIEPLREKNQTHNSYCLMLVD